MNNQLNWNKIKQALKENIIEPDFQQYASSAFIGVNFENGLEIFRYILELKLPNHDETKSIFNKMELYANGHQNKEILNELVNNYEPFLRNRFKTLKN